MDMDWDKLPAVLTVSEVASLLRIGRSQMYDLVRHPGFPIIRIGRAIRIPREHLRSWVDERIQSSVDD